MWRLQNENARLQKERADEAEHLALSAEKWGKKVLQQMDQAEWEWDRAEQERDGVVRKLADANKTLEELQEDNQN